MAPQDTNTKKEARRHVGPLIGMAAAVAIVAAGFFWWISQATVGDESAEEVTEQVPAE